MSSRLVSRLISVLTALAATSCALPVEDDVAGRRAAVTCPPNLLRHPVHGPHNTGYDRSWSDFRCDGSLANTDYGGDHHGIDIFAPRGTEVVSPVDGRVIRAGVASSSSGNRVTIQDGCGWAYYHGHLDTIRVPNGATVRAGDLIGTVGNTGTPTAPHVHFNISRDAYYYDDVDPLPLLLPVEGSSCGPAPECVGRRDGSFCVDATRIGTCAGGSFSVGDCAAYGTGCDMDTGVGRCTPHLDAVFVGSSFVGGTRIEVPVGEEVHGCLTYRNTGSWSWTPDVTRLGTTEPRDRPSAHSASDWLAPHRLAAVEVDTLRGAEGRFCFSLRGGATPGERTETFSLVDEGFFWAADTGGVPDAVNRLTVVTLESADEPPPPPPVPPPPAPVPPTDDGDAGTPEPDASPLPPIARNGVATLHGGCSVTPGRGGTQSGALFLALLVMGMLRARFR